MPLDVLIIGAGPTGLVLATWLAKLGVETRIIDRLGEASTTSRALAVQARTLELYRQADLAETVVERGHKTPAVNLWVKGRKAARVPFTTAGAGLTPYPFLFIYPQDEHERLLIERLQSLGVGVERGVELVGLEDRGDCVRARLRQPGGEEETCDSAWLAGCDGASSLVRESLGVGFSGGSYRQVFYVADVVAEGPPIDGELHIDLDQADFLAVFPLAVTGRVRLVGTVRDERADRADTLTFMDVQDRAIANLKISIVRVNWFSTYRVHHRVASHFRRRRAFLLGDAAHIHSPAGGQGMNTGIGDAINLAWKLAAVVGGSAPETLLDSYEAERIGFARRLVATTDRAFTLATAEGSLADQLRTRIAPLVIPMIAGLPEARQFLFRTVSQITLNYRDGPLSAGSAGRVQGGDRLPWAVVANRDNFASLTAMNWQVHVYGSPSPALSQWCADHALPFEVFAWDALYGQVGLARDAAYLLRPDSYVALADPTGSPGAVESYFAGRGFDLSPIGRA